MRRGVAVVEDEALAVHQAVDDGQRAGVDRQIRQRVVVVDIAAVEFRFGGGEAVDLGGNLGDARRIEKARADEVALLLELRAFAFGDGHAPCPSPASCSSR